MKTTRLHLIFIGITILLFVPLVAMQFTTEVNWTVSDFIFAAILLYGTGMVCELVLRKVKTTQKRILICGAVLAALVLLWVEMAVGIFGSPIAGN